MPMPHLLGPIAYAEELLEQQDAYIVAVARKKVPRNAVRAEEVADEVDELAQHMRIKLWRLSLKENVMNPWGYINRVASTEAVDMVRQHKMTVPLSLTKDGELVQGHLLGTAGDGIQDPAEELEQKERLADCIEFIIDGVLALPPVQQRALVCSLKEKKEELLLLMDALRTHGVDVEAFNWPASKEEVQRLRASLSIARKKMRSLLGELLSKA